MASALAKQIPANVRAELHRQGISQAALAKHLFGRVDNTTRNLVWRRLAGRVPFAAEELLEIAAFLDVSLDSLTVAA